jgi:peptide chain release factor 2
VPAGTLAAQEPRQGLGHAARPIYEAELKKREEAANAEAASKTEIGWGHQIRSYVLQPYQLVKDLRTGTESTNPQGVLDGNLDEFMEAALAQRVYGGGEDVADID